MSVYDLTGRKALVTGGARGLGAGMALRQGTPRRREGPQAGRGLAGAAPLQGRQGPEAGDQGAAARQRNPLAQLRVYTCH